MTIQWFNFTRVSNTINSRPTVFLSRTIVIWTVDFCVDRDVSRFSLPFSTFSSYFLSISILFVVTMKFRVSSTTATVVGVCQEEEVERKQHTYTYKTIYIHTYTNTRGKNINVEKVNKERTKIKYKKKITGRNKSDKVHMRIRE